MPLSCSAYNCTTRFESGKGISFFRFPKDFTLRKQWLQAVRRKNWLPSPYAVVCSLHFEESCLDRSGNTCRLKPDAVPTLFDFSGNPKQVHFTDDQFERTRVDGKRPLKPNAVPTLFKKVDTTKSSKKKMLKTFFTEGELSEDNEEVLPEHSYCEMGDSATPSTSGVSTRSSTKSNTSGRVTRSSLAMKEDPERPSKSPGASGSSKATDSKNTPALTSAKAKAAAKKRKDDEPNENPPKKKGPRRRKELMEDWELEQFEMEFMVLHPGVQRAEPIAKSVDNPVLRKELYDDEIEVRRHGRYTKTFKSSFCQTDLNMHDISKMEKDLMSMSKDVISLRRKVLDVDFTEETLKESEEEVEFYTGMPTLTMLMTVFNYVAPHVTTSHNKLNSFTEFLILMIHIRFNLSLEAVGFKFGSNVSTVFKIVDKWLLAMYEHLGMFVSWPDRKLTLESMPSDFKCLFGDRVVVIIDCVEVYIDKHVASLTAPALARYKHQDTVKFLIGITPQGVISYISEAWDGKIAEADIIERADVLDYLLPGDVVIADSGFGFYCAEIRVEEDTGEKVLVNLDLQQSQLLSRIRMHIEKLVGVVPKKYQIVNSPLYVEYDDRKLKVDYINRTIKVCCALTNLSNSGLSCESYEAV